MLPLTAEQADATELTLFLADRPFSSGMQIELRGVRVHNLKGVDLDLPYNKLIVFCGLSGSGKSSLAMDTLYAEGQRRYIESFSSYTRQFLEKLEKPDAQRIDGIPPALAVTSKSQGQISRSTVGTATETIEYLRLLFAKIGRLHCPFCRRSVRIDTPDSVLAFFDGLSTCEPMLNGAVPEEAEDPRSTNLANGSEFIRESTSKHSTETDRSSSPAPSFERKGAIAFVPPAETFDLNYQDFFAHWRSLGLVRCLFEGKTLRLDDDSVTPALYDAIRNACNCCDRETASPVQSEFEELNAETESADESFGERDGESVENVAFAPEIPIRPQEENGDEGEGFDDAEEETKDTSGFFLGMDKETVVSDTAIDKSVSDKSQDDTKTGHGKVTVPFCILIDRVVFGKTEAVRIRDSLETAFRFGEGKVWVFTETRGLEKTEATGIAGVYDLFGEERPCTIFGFSDRLSCEDCGIDFPPKEPRLFSFNSPLGACPTCEGFGNLVTYDLDLIVPNRNRSIKDGAVAPWTSPSYRSKLVDFLKVASDIDFPIDIPFRQLTPEQLVLFLYGNEKKNGRGNVGTSSRHVGKTASSKPATWPGLISFFEKLQKQKYKMHIRVFLSRWRSYRPCPDCHGTRLRAESLAVTIGCSSANGQNVEAKNIADLAAMKISDLLVFLRRLELSDWERSVAKTALEQSISRLTFLEEVGIGYLTLERPMRTLSAGEQRRVGLTSALGSSLVDMLYVLDEPSIGLHPNDTTRLLKSIEQLRDRGNTVVVVEHEETILRAADRIVEIGPEAGLGGGHIVFQGTIDELLDDSQSLTGSYLTGKRGGGKPAKRRPTQHGVIELFGASGHNLRNIDVAFPMGVLCLVSGVSGAGKSSLVQETLYPALCKQLGKENTPRALPYSQILGVGQIDDVVMVDQSPIGRSPRSNPVTYLKIFDEIRNVFTETNEAKTRGYTAGYFSFNVDGGRCDTCKGDGFIAIDMQFMADMYIRCPQCHGKRYRKEILEVNYRGKSIAEVLDMTAREAFIFFRGQNKVQQKLKRLIDVGLDYVRLGQPANTLSGGESQRLKLAAYLSHVKRGRCLFLLDEPTTGLHFADVVQLLDCFDALIETGHSLIVVEHNLQLMKAADFVIDLGPGAAEQGGRVVAAGTPEEIARCHHSATGRFLAEML